MTVNEKSESEWKTRKARIDPKLVALGWTITWLKDEDIEDSDELPEPEELTA